MIIRSSYFYRSYSSQILHSHPIPFQYLAIEDVDKIYRKMRYYDSEISSSSSQIPIVLLCGTAQSIVTWTSHLRHFSSISRLIIPELRCQGATDLLSSVSSITQHVEDLHQFLQQKINLIGFSLGGRVGLAFTATYPDYVNKLSITGVPLTRPPLGHLILQSWKEGLDHEDFRATAWSCILNGFSTNFLTKNSKAIPTLVNNVIENNNMERLRDLLTNTLLSSHSPQYIESYISGSEDRIAGNGSEKELANMLPFGSYEEILECGHLVPFEKPGVWRSSVTKFLNAEGVNSK